MELFLIVGTKSSATEASTLSAFTNPPKILASSNTFAILPGCKSPT